MKPPERVRVTFREAAGLVAFCDAIRDYRISYLLAGSNAVILNAYDFLRVQEMKVGALEDHKPRVEFVAGLDPKAQAVAARQRLMPRDRVLENIRARLSNLR